MTSGFISTSILAFAATSSRSIYRRSSRLSVRPCGEDSPLLLSIATPIALTNTNESAGYELDGLGNWRRFTTDPVGGSATTQIRQHNGLNEIARAGSIDFEYDGVPGASNGNLTNDGTLKYEWDAFNRLTKVYETPSSPVLIATYTYDALNRRIRKLVESGGLPNQSNLDGTTDFLYLGMQCVEERNPFGVGSTDVTLKQYVWGIYLDECIQMKTLVSITTGPTGSTTTYTAGAYYPLQDLLYRTIALANSSGAIVEAYDYDAYGNTLVFNAAGTGSNWWADNARQVPDSFLPFLFTGQRLNSETQLYYYKLREYAPTSGRFLSRDLINYADSFNIYLFVQSNPTNYTDPTGLGAPKPKKCSASDSCTALIAKMTFFETDFFKRLGEWVTDKNDIRGEKDPCNADFKSYLNHYRELINSMYRVGECFVLALIICPPDTPPTPPREFPIIPHGRPPIPIPIPVPRPIPTVPAPRPIPPVRPIPNAPWRWPLFIPSFPIFIIPDVLIRKPGDPA